MKTQHLTLQLQAQFPQHYFDPQNISVLHKGKFANAIVFRYKDEAFDFVIKDFHHSPWFIRRTFARLFIRQEFKALKRLEGMEGVSEEFYRISPLGLAYGFIEGTPLKSLTKKGKKLPKTFFSQLETMVAEMHRRGLVHLDLRNLGNILIGKDGNPYFIDFQSSMTFARFPRFIQKYMRGADLSGIYKSWTAVCSEPLSGYKKEFFTHFNQLRKRWIFRGYPLHYAYTSICGVLSQLPGAGLVRDVVDKLHG